MSKKIIVYIIGLFFMALGVTFSIKSQLGISPVNSIPYIVSLITGIEQGYLIVGIFTLFIFMQILMLRNKFKWINIFQLVFSSVFGYFVTFTNSIFTFESPESYMIRMALLIISMLCVAIGVILYLRANILPMPPEGCMMAIQEITKKEFHKIKSTFDALMVIGAVLLSLLFLGGFAGVREGTIIAALGIGKIIGVLEKKFHRQISGIVEFVES